MKAAQVLALRHAATLVRSSNRSVQQIAAKVYRKHKIHVDGRTISGMQRSHRYQIGKAIALVM